MTHSLKFYTDENVAKAVVHGLRRRGVDVLSAPEAAMLAKQDEVHLAFAIKEGRALVTRDEDFRDTGGRTFLSATNTVPGER